MMIEISRMGFYKGVMNSLFRKREDNEMAIEDVSYIVIDTELTGLDPKRDSIISIGAVKISRNGIDLGKTFHRLIKASTDLKPESIVIHGITPSDLTEKPPIEEVLPEFLEFCGSDIIIGHFISIDIHFLRKGCKKVGLEFENPYIDTYEIYKWIKGNSGSFSRHYEEEGNGKDLFSIAREYDIPVKGGHDALSDAFITAQIFQRFLMVLPGLGVRKVKELLRIGKP